MEQWSNGATEQRSKRAKLFLGSLVPWFHDSWFLVLGSWFLFLVSWFLGSLVPWVLGSLVPWFLGYFVPLFLCSFVSWFQSSWRAVNHMGKGLLVLFPRFLVCSLYRHCQWLGHAVVVGKGYHSLLVVSWRPRLVVSWIECLRKLECRMGMDLSSIRVDQPRLVDIVWSSRLGRNQHGYSQARRPRVGRSKSGSHWTVRHCLWKFGCVCTATCRSLMYSWYAIYC